MFGDLADELFEGGYGFGVEVGTGYADVSVEVGDGVGEVVFVLFCPLGGAHEAFFFGVPTADDDSALRFPTLLEKDSEAMDGFEHGSGAAVGIDGSVDPGVTVIAGDDPVVFLRGIGALDGADDVPDGAEGVVLLKMHVDDDFVCVGVVFACAEVVGEGKGSLPAVRCGLAAEALEDRGGVFVGQGIDGDVGLVDRRVSGCEALRVGQVGSGGYARGFGVAGIDGEELHGAALDGGVGAEGTLGVDVAAEVAVVGGVGVDENAFGSALLGDVGLDTAEVGSVADDDDLVFDADAELVELVEVG